MTFSDLYSSRLDEELATTDSTQRFTTARRKAAINLGQGRFASLTECLIRQSTITLTGDATTFEYNLHSTTVLGSSDFLRIAPQGVEIRAVDASSQATYVSGPDLQFRSIEWLNRYEPGWRDSTGASTTFGTRTPSAYYVRPDGGALYLGFYPAPSTGSSASMFAVVPYMAQPADMTSDTAEPFTIGSNIRQDLRPYHQALAHYGAYQLEKLRPDPQASLQQFQLFMTYVDEYRQDKRKRGGETLSVHRRYFRRPGLLGRLRPQDPWRD